MSDISAARYAARRLKQIAQRQVKAVEPRKRRMPVRPSEQARRFMDGEEAWRVEAGLVTPEQYQRYMETMQRRMEE